MKRERWPTSVSVAKGPSEGAAHPDVPVLQVLQHQLLHWDWLTINLEALTLVPGNGTRQNQQLGEQEDVQLLEGTTTTTPTLLMKKRFRTFFNSNLIYNDQT